MGADYRFERAAIAQAAEPPDSATRAIFAVYGREVPLTEPLVNLLDSMLTIVPARRATLAAAGLWLARVGTIKREIGGLTAAGSSPLGLDGSLAPFSSFRYYSALW